jgi:hypothetical protein
VIIAPGDEGAGKFPSFSTSTMRQSKQNLAAKILEFMGAEILLEIQRQPQWEQNLDSI